MLMRKKNLKKNNNNKSFSLSKKKKHISVKVILHQSSNNMGHS